MSRTLALRLLSTCLVVLAGLVVIGCSDHSGKSVSERLTGAPAIAQENGLSLTADPPSIVIDPDDPNTPTDPDNANKRYGETALTAIALDEGGAPQAGLPLTFTTSAGKLASAGAAVNTDDTGTATDTLRVYEDDPAEIQVSVTDGTRTTTITVAKVVAAAPVANAGPDQTVECTGEGGATVTLDASATTDENGDIVSFEWFEHHGTAEEVSLGTGMTLTVALPVGTHTITLVVTDATEKTSTDEVVIDVVDTQPPAVELRLRPARLWPPNHKLVPVHADLGIQDCGEVTVRLVSVTSSEPDNGTGDGDTANDIQGVEAGTDDRDFMLRAERSGHGSGRVYTVVYEIVDAGGLATTATSEIRVPHDQSGK
jgi:hypothetical protein